MEEEKNKRLSAIVHAPRTKYVPYMVDYIPVSYCIFLLGTKYHILSFPP
jgi:hypothetical protein